VFCYLASVGHWHDVGGNVPGNYNPVATECFQEGMLIPPVKLFSKGELRQDIVDILAANSRLPGSLIGDLSGQINALDLGARRLAELLSEFSAATLTTVFAELQQRAAQLMRANIAELPDGKFSVDDWLDNDGVVDEPLKIALDLTIDGDVMSLDFSRSSPACAGPVNISRSTAIASVYVAIKHIFTDVPANAGVLEPINIIIPDGTLLSVTAPKPVGGYTETILRVIDNVHQGHCRGCAGTLKRLRLWHHQRPVAGRPPQRWAALGDV
jgi:N-methylhydantoinase B